jgi:hypothetical protein
MPGDASMNARNCSGNGVIYCLSKRARQENGGRKAQIRSLILATALVGAGATG